MVISFILLNYNNTNVTNKAVECIRKQQFSGDTRIVIVDNGSLNNSAKELQKKYGNSNDITVLLNQKNLGFAKGNNIGYMYAKNDLHSDIIIVMNTDVFIYDTRFLEKLAEKQDLSEIIAPDIVNLRGEHQNPFKTRPISIYKICYLMLYNVAVQLLYNVPFFGKRLSMLLERRRKNKYNTVYLQRRQRDIVPHGACIIYMHKWIEKENIAYVPITFMYLEEDVLFEYLSIKGYSTVYDPELVVTHAEDASLNSTFNSVLKRRKFFSKCMYKSAFALLKMRMQRVKIIGKQSK